MNPYDVNHTPLKRARLPVPPLSRVAFGNMNIISQIFKKSSAFFKIIKKIWNFINKACKPKKSPRLVLFILGSFGDNRSLLYRFFPTRIPPLQIKMRQPKSAQKNARPQLSPNKTNYTLNEKKRSGKKGGAVRFYQNKNRTSYSNQCIMFCLAFPLYHKYG